MYSNNLLRTFCLFCVFTTVLSDRTDNEKSRSKRTVGLLLSGLSNFLNVHDELQVTTPISITTSAPNYNKRPPPPKVQKWPPLDFELTPYVLSLISAKKPTPTEAPTHVPPTEEPYYQAQVFFVPLRDLENHLNNQYEQKINHNAHAYNNIGQQYQQSHPNLLYPDPVSRNRLVPERYAQKHEQQSPPLLQSNHQTNIKVQAGSRQSTNSTTKKKPSLQQKDIDEILEKLTSIFANPHDGELTRIAGNDVNNDKTQFMSFIDQEPRLASTRQQSPEKNKDLLNLYLLERMQRLQNNVKSIRIPTSVNNVVKRPKSNPPEETKVEIIKSVEPDVSFSTDPESESQKDNLNLDIGDRGISDGIENSNHAKEAERNDETPVSYNIARSLEYPILNSSSRSNFDTGPNIEAAVNSFTSKANDRPTPQIGRSREVENRENSPIQIHFSPSIEAVKNYDSEDEIYATSFPKAASESYDRTDTRFIGYQGHQAVNIPPRSNGRGEFRYPVPLNSAYNVFRQIPKATQDVDGSGIFKGRNRQFTRVQRPQSKIKSSFDSNHPFPSSVNGPENQYDKYHSQRPKQETQLHFFLPDEDSLRKPEQFSKPNNHYENPSTEDDYYQYQRDDFYQSNPEDYGSFPYQLGSGEATSKYTIPKAIHSPKLPDDIHDELYNSISRSHLGPPPAFDQDIAKTELRTSSVPIRRGRELFTPHSNNNNSQRSRYH